MLTFNEKTGLPINGKPVFVLIFIEREKNEPGEPGCVSTRTLLFGCPCPRWSCQPCFLETTRATSPIRCDTIRIWIHDSCPVANMCSFVRLQEWSVTWELMDPEPSWPALIAATMLIGLSFGTDVRKNSENKLSVPFNAQVGLGDWPQLGGTPKS